MILKANTFFVNGYRCHIDCVGRDQYEGYLDGELIKSGMRSQVKNALTLEAKYRVAVEPDEAEVADAVKRYIDMADGWITESAIQSEICPNGEYWFRVSHALGHLDRCNIIEEGTVTTKNEKGHSMWRSL